MSRSVADVFITLVLQATPARANRMFSQHDRSIIKAKDLSLSHRQGVARDFNEKLVACAQLERAAEEERQSISTTDKFDVHDLDANALSELRGRLNKITGLKKACLVKKRVKNLPQKPIYVLAFSIKRGFGLRPKYTHDEVMYQLNSKVAFSQPTFLIDLGVNKKFSRKLKKSGAEVGL